MTAQDHPHLRASLDCPCCTRPKKPGQLICFGCWQCTGLVYGPGADLEAEKIIDDAEARLSPQ
jgi:hypothetical protein